MDSSRRVSTADDFGFGMTGSVGRQGVVLRAVISEKIKGNRRHMSQVTGHKKARGKRKWRSAEGEGRRQETGVRSQETE